MKDMLKRKRAQGMILPSGVLWMVLLTTFTKQVQAFKAAPEL